MEVRAAMNLRPLTDAALLARLTALVRQERGGVADIIAHLAEVDRREIVVDAGYSTLFDYCVKTLHYSEAAAFLRTRAARAAARFPRILDDLRSGAIHLDAVMRLFPYLSPENSDRLLDEASGATKREVLAIVEGLNGPGAASERDIIRRLPARPAASPAADEAGPGRAPSVPPHPSDRTFPSDAAPGEPPPSEVIAPPSRVRLAFTADDDFLFMVERLRSLRRHKFPEGRLSDLLKESVGALLDRVDPDRRKTARRRSAAREKPLVAKRRIPSAVKAEVWARDEGRCAYVASDGRRCESRDFLEYDHIQPWALGGRSDHAGNIRLLCRPHNQRLARKRFGPRRRAARSLVRPDAVGNAVPRAP
jgi:5-methylcytosine-specific restriction endonuclease McrA